MSKCLVCGNETEIGFNIDFKFKPICESCACRITMQQVKFLCFEYRTFGNTIPGKNCLKNCFNIEVLNAGSGLSQETTAPLGVQNYNLRNAKIDLAFIIGYCSTAYPNDKTLKNKLNCIMSELNKK